MVAKKLAFAFCAFGFLQTSFAGSEQRALIHRYQSLKELPEAQSTSLQQRMDWFTQLPEQEKQKMRETWQKMSSQERRELAIRMQKATPEERPIIREEYISKYSLQTTIPH